MLWDPLIFTAVTHILVRRYFYVELPLDCEVYMGMWMFVCGVCLWCYEVGWWIPFNLGPFHGPLARYVKLRIVHALGMPGTVFPLPRVSDHDMHPGTCVTHVPGCMSGSLTSDFLWNLWRGKRSWHSRLMRNQQFYVFGKRRIEPHGLLIDIELVRVGDLAYTSIRLYEYILRVCEVWRSPRKYIRDSREIYPGFILLELGEQISMKFKSKYNTFHSRNWIWICHLQNGGHLVSASILPDITSYCA